MRRQLGIASLLWAAALAWVVAGSAAVAGGADGDHRPGRLRRTDVRDRQRHRQPRRTGDDVVRRVRHEHELRLAVGERERGLRLGERRRLARALRARRRDDLPLPRRGDERRRHEPRRRRDLHHPVRADRGHRRRDRRDARLGDAQRQRRPERPRDDVVLRVRDEHELRLEDGGEGRRLGRQRGRRLGRARGPRARPPLYTTGSSRRATRDEPRRRPDVRDVGAPAVTTDAGVVGGTDVGAAERHDHPNGQSTSWYFDYGTSTSYGARTAVKGAGSGTGATRVNASLTRAGPASPTTTASSRRTHPGRRSAAIGPSARRCSPSSGPRRRAMRPRRPRR